MGSQNIWVIKPAGTYLNSKNYGKNKKIELVFIF
jgi:hypothetical protein